MLRGHSGGGLGVSCMKHDQNGEMMAASVSLSGFGPAASSVYTESSQKRPGRDALQSALSFCLVESSDSYTPDTCMVFRLNEFSGAVPDGFSQ